MKRPGHTDRLCPVCRQIAGTHREPVADERGEVVVYHLHDDGRAAECVMSGKQAAIRAVAFTKAAA